MKIKKLIFQNINSLYGRWEINFDCDEFRKNGLFAITGKTGSGKSTILDAITLALYGTTPRLEKSTTEAVSRGCSECMSELTFLDKDNREWKASFAYRAVQRGEHRGEICDKALHTLVCEGVTEADKTTEVKRKVEELIGLDSIRFCRAVLLAQGSFDAFLSAGNDNGVILERITGTEVYSRIAVKLKERFDSEKNKLAEINAACSGITLLDEEIAEEKRKEAAALDLQIAELADRQKALNSLMQIFQQLELHNSALEKCKAAEAALTDEENAFAPSRKRLAEGQNALEADKLYRPCKELQSAQDAANTALQKNLLLQKEQEILCEKSAKEREILSAESEEYQKEFEKLNILLTTVRTLDNTIRHLESNSAAAAEKRKNALMQAIKMRKELHTCSRQLEELRKTHREGALYLAAHPADGELPNVQKLCSEWMESAKKQSLELDAVLRQKNTLLKEVQELEKKQTIRKKQLEAETMKHASLAADMEKAEKSLAELLAGSTREHWSALAEKQEQICQQALLLRSLDEHRRNLKPGSPCPLCGSIEHPFALDCPSEPEKEKLELVKLKERLTGISAAEQLVRQIAVSLEISSGSSAQFSEVLTQLEEQLTAKKGDITAVASRLLALEEDVSLTYKKIDDALASCGIVRNQEQNRLPELLNVRISEYKKYKAEQEEFESRNNSLQNSRLRLQTAFAAQLSAALTCKKELAAEKGRLTLEKEKRKELFGSKNPDTEGQDAEKKRKNLAAKQEKAGINATAAQANLERTREEIRNLEKAVSERAVLIINTRTAFLHACEQAGMTEEMFHACVLEKEEMAALTAADTDLKARRKQLTETRKNSEETAAALKVQLQNQPKKEQAAQELNNVSEVFRQKNLLLGALREQLKQDAANKERMAEQHQKLQEQQKVFEVWNNLYNLIGSKDKFQRFAQGITLEHLLTLANLELAKLTDRYRLLRNPEQELGIDVADKDQGDEIRSCKTLSGGERFLISLALALGLSQMAGEKIRVDSLFLDEGFGTLDSETLDTALEALSSLRNRGKLVGVISHVAELSEKIPCTIQVIKQGGGRSIITGSGVRALDKVPVSDLSAKSGKKGRKKDVAELDQ